MYINVSMLESFEFCIESINMIVKYDYDIVFFKYKYRDEYCIIYLE